MKKKLSTAGLILGGILGVIAGLFAGSWVLWLGLGLAIGWAAGSIRRSRPGRETTSLRERQEAHP